MRTPTSGPILIALVAVFAGAVMFATTSVTVVEGDTLHAIGVRHGVSTADLVAWNDIDDPDRIYVGDVILLAAPADADTGAPQPVQHVVSAGDTLTVIAARYGASVASIAAANGLSDVDFIRVGQRLTVGDPPEPADDPAPPPTPADDPADAAVVEHTIAPGDTLFSIARRYERTISAIAAANGITDTERIRSGDVLVIPAAGADESPDAAPADETETETDAPDADAAAGAATADGDEDEASGAQADQTDPPASEPADPPEDDAEADAPARGAAPDPSASAAGLADAFELWSISYGVDQALLEAIAWYATDWNPATVGIDGRVGIAQMTPAQIDLVETALLGRDLDPFDGPDGVRLAARYLRYVQDRTHSEEEALMAFRQGLDSLTDNGATADAEAFALAVLDIRDQRA